MQWMSINMGICCDNAYKCTLFTLSSDGLHNMCITWSNSERLNKGEVFHLANSMWYWWGSWHELVLMFITPIQDHMSARECRYENHTPDCFNLNDDITAVFINSLFTICHHVFWYRMRNLWIWRTCWNLKTSLSIKEDDAANNQTGVRMWNVLFAHYSITQE